MFFIHVLLFIVGWLGCGIIVTAIGEEYFQDANVINDFDDRVWGVLFWPLWMVCLIIWLIGKAFSHPTIGAGRLIVSAIMSIRKAIRRNR